MAFPVKQLHLGTHLASPLSEHGGQVGVALKTLKGEDMVHTETAELSGELVQFLVVADGVRRTVSIQGPRCYGRPAPALSASRSATLSSTRSSRLAGCVCVAALAAPL